MEINETLDNPYFKECFKRASIILNRETDFFLEKGEKREEELSVEEAQILNEFKFLTRLANQLEDVTKISDLFIQYEPKDWLSTDEVSDLDTIRLFTEMTLNKIFAVRDTMVQIANKAYALGLSEKKLRWGLVEKKEVFRKSHSSEIMNNFYQEFESLFEIRNAFTHEGDYLDSEYDEINGVYFIIKHSNNSKGGLDERLNASLANSKFKIDKLKLKRHSLLVHWEGRVFTHVFEFLKSLPIKQ
ncbi:Cthe_2314 family HEPN domain-containing protein [Algoriphagus yeomjeoni]|uniref:Cthe_2314 family HEPN domain-containing protein n=1 Tax=Algoriphagus yeomjeoni TaxID=291403 RepID=UPI003CE58BA4